MRKDIIEIIHEDNDILVINKPAGVSVTKDRARRPQLTDFLREQLGEEPTAKLRLVHRLDKDTSGVMILAKNRPAQRQFADYFFNRQVKKTYLAIVRGAVFGDEGVINEPLNHCKKNPELMVIDKHRGKESVTEWRLLADFNLAALLAVNPLTGRTHQIRVHLASRGMPLAIDPLYSTTRPIMLSEFKKDYRFSKTEEEKPLIERMTLHAYQILLPDQAGIRPDYFIARLDKKFAATIKMLTKHNPQGPEAFYRINDFEKIITGQPL